MSVPVILASNSPRRKELLKKLVDFSVQPAVAEEFSDATDPKQYATDLAKHKAREVSLQNKDAIVIGCDTVVDLDGAILGKPQDEADAFKMLSSLSGKTHFVHTGVCVLHGEKEACFCESTAVTFRQLCDEEIWQYVKSGAPMDKAGAYGIQECNFVQGFVGSYDNVVGLPTERLGEVLKNLYKR